MRATRIWATLWIVLGVIYFFLPLVGTLDFSLRARRDTLSLAAYATIFSDRQFYSTFAFSAEMAVLTIIASVAIVLPTAYWVHLWAPRVRPVLEVISLLPFVIPAIVLVFGLIKTYSRPPFPLVATPALLVASYVVLSLPYMYRAIDTGLRAMDVRSLTEAAQSLGAGWPTILLRVILPNLRVALLSGAFLTFAIVIGEFTLAQYLAWPAFGPYMARMGQDRAYEPAALAIVSFALTWGITALMLLLGRRPGGGGQGQQLAAAK
jgi:putative spermidine/putrescine transport system permease protein